MKKLFSVLLLVVLSLSVASAAMARTVTADGTVVSTGTVIVSSDVGGTVAEVFVSAGDAVTAGDVLVTLAPSRVYALQDGTVRLFGSVGDDAADVASQYGAVAYVEPALRYTISASTRNAYSSEENKIIHPGETVYLRATENAQLTGTGRVTTVSGTSYTVEVLTGNLESGYSVNIFRSEDYAATSRIGRASVSLKDPVAYTAEGLITAFCVKDGAQVKKGDALFETVSASWPVDTSTLTQVIAPVNGVVSSISLNKGSTLSAGSAVAEIWPDENLRIEASVPESDLALFTIGKEVSVELNYLSNGEYTFSGTVEKVSRIGTASASAESEEAVFSVWIRPDSTEHLSYGLHAIVTVSDSAVKTEAE